MKKNILLIALLFFCMNAFSQVTYTNPILSGFYPDPSICRVGNDFYLVNSSFAYFPGLPIFHSKDLVNWQQIGHAMSRESQLDLKGAGVSRGLFAPTIRYHNGIFYIVCTLIDKKGNFLITAKDPAGPWSDPFWLHVDGIDPSLFFDDDKAYLLYNSIPPDNKSLYDGHRTIRMREFDMINMKAKGEEKIIVNGGTDINKKPVWIEGPHILKKGGWYYLLCAEGGTGYNHSEVVFRSKDVDGPYISYQNNPILTQRQLNSGRKDPVTTTGHADLVEATDGIWYAVFLGCRPYEGSHFNTGRETFMTPVEWIDGWPIINPGHERVEYRYPVPMPRKTKKVENNFSGNLYFRDNFAESNLNDRFAFLRYPVEHWYNLSEKKGWLAAKLLPQTCAGKDNPAFVGFRQPHLKGYAAVSVDFKPAAENEKAGILIFQNETHFYFLCRSIDKGLPVVQLYQSVADDKNGKTLLLQSQVLNEVEGELQLKIAASGNSYAFYYAGQKDKWILLKANVPASFLSTETAGGFVGCMYAMYATANGLTSDNKAYFNWFECRSDDDVYKIKQQ